LLFPDPIRTMRGEGSTVSIWLVGNLKDENSEGDFGLASSFGENGWPTIGLVIQGPLQSFGKVPSTGEYVKARKDGTLVNFDCNETVNRWWREYGELFDHVVLSTWEDEDTSQIDMGIDVVCSTKKQLTHTVRPDGKPETRFWQFFGVAQGLEPLVERGIEFALRVRTDQFFDPSELISWIKNSHFRDSREWILVPYLVSRDPTHLGDFYLLSRTNFLSRILQRYSSVQYPLFESIHKDIFWSFYVFARNSLEETLSAVREIVLAPFKSRLQHSAWGSLYFPGPTHLLRTLYWRGERFEDDNKLFKIIEKVTGPAESVDLALAFRNEMPPLDKCRSLIERIVPSREVVKGFETSVRRRKVIPGISLMQNHPLVRLRKLLLRLCFGLRRFGRKSD